MKLLHKVLGLMREFSMGLVVGIQQPRGVTPYLFANTGTKIIQRCNDARDLDYCLRMAGYFDPVIRREAQRQLRPGFALAIDSRFPGTIIPLTIPLLEDKTEVNSSTVIARYLAKLDQLYEPAEAQQLKALLHPSPTGRNESQNVILLPAPKHQKQAPSESNPRKVNKTQTQARVQTESARLIYCLASAPLELRTETEMFQALGISSGSLKKRIKDYLVVNQLVTIHELQKTKVFIKAWQLTGKAHADNGIPIPKLDTIGGWLHTVIAHTVAKWAKANGFQTFIEHMLSHGKSVDVVATKQSDTIHVEVCVSSPYRKELSNAIKSFQAETTPSRLVFVVVNNKVRKQLQQLIDTDEALMLYRRSITITLATEYMSKKNKVWP